MQQNTKKVYTFNYTFKKLLKKCILKDALNIPGMFQCTYSLIH